MRQIEKDKYTREAVESEIKRIEKFLVSFVDGKLGQDGVSINTWELHQKVGALRALRGVLFE